jgi:hypothetical protein
MTPSTQTFFLEVPTKTGKGHKHFVWQLCVPSQKRIRSNASEEPPQLDRGRVVISQKATLSTCIGGIALGRRGKKDLE